MQTIPLILNQQLNKDSDSAAKVGTGDSMINAYSDKTGAINTFPGLELLCDLNTGSGTGVDGLFWWENQNEFVAISDGRFFTIDDKYGSFTEITGHTFSKKVPVSFTLAQNTLLAANKSRIGRFTGAALAPIADADAPTNVSHLEFLKSYIVALDATNNAINTSNVSDETNWDALDFVSAEASPDPLKALHKNYQEISAFGTNSIEIFVNASDTPLISLSSSYTERGVSAAYSIAKANNTYYFLDDDKRVATITGRTPQIISPLMDDEISKLSVIDDAIGMNVTSDNLNFYVLTFPTEGKTYYFDYALSRWGELGTWNTITGTYDRWLGNCFARSIPWNMGIIGSHKDGKIYKLTKDSETNAGDIRRALIRTGHINHGTNNWKLSGKITLHLKRGQSSSTTPVVQLRYKDNGMVGWSDYITGDLGVLGDEEFYVTFEPMGTYRSRQYEIVLSDSVPLVLVNASEDVEVER